MMLPVTNPYESPSRLQRLPGMLAKVAVSIGLVALLAWWADWRALGDVLRGADVGLLCVSLLVLLPAIPLTAWRWRHCASASAISMSMGFFVRATYAGTFAGQMLPAGLGTDAVRLGFLVHRRAGISRALQSLLLDRIVGVLTIVAVMAAGLPRIWPQLPQILRLFAVALIGGALGALAFIWALKYFQRLREFAGQGKRRKLIDLVFAVRSSLLSTQVAFALVPSTLMFLLSNAAVVLIAQALGLHIGYLEVLAVVSMAVFVSLLPISVNGWGVREGAMVLGLSVLMVPKATALAISILFGFGGALITLPGAFAWFFGRQAGAPLAVPGQDR